MAAYYDRFRGPGSQLFRSSLGRIRHLVFTLPFFTRDLGMPPTTLLLDIRLWWIKQGPLTCSLMLRLVVRPLLCCKSISQCVTLHSFTLLPFLFHGGGFGPLFWHGLFGAQAGMFIQVRAL